MANPHALSNATIHTLIKMEKLSPAARKLIASETGVDGEASDDEHLEDEMTEVDRAFIASEGEVESDEDDEDDEDETEIKPEKKKESLLQRKRKRRHDAIETDEGEDEDTTDEYRADTSKLSKKFREEGAKADGVKQRTKTRTQYREVRSKSMLAPAKPPKGKPLCRAEAIAPDYQWALQIPDPQSFFETMKVCLSFLDTTTLRLVKRTNSKGKHVEAIKVQAQDQEQPNIYTESAFTCGVVAGKDEHGKDVDVNEVTIIIHAQLLLEVLSTVLKSCKQGSLLIYKLTKEKKQADGISGSFVDVAASRVWFESRVDGTESVSRMFVPELSTPPIAYRPIKYSKKHTQMQFADVPAFRTFVNDAKRHKAGQLEFELQAKDTEDQAKISRLVLRYEGGTETTSDAAKANAVHAGMGQERVLVTKTETKNMKPNTVHDTDVIKEELEKGGLERVFQNFIRTQFLHPFVHEMTNSQAVIDMYIRHGKPFIFIYRNRGGADVTIVIANELIVD